MVLQSERITSARLDASERAQEPAAICQRVHFNRNVFLLLSLIELSVIIWNAFDHSLPCWDTVDHRLCSGSVYELFKHPHFRSVEWFRSVFAVSYLYPPLFYFVSATLKFVLGPLAETELVSNLIFVAVLFLSTYYIARETFKSSLAASVAAILVFMYPLVFWSTHCAMLDCAANAMVALGLATFLWWSKRQSFKRSVVLGLVLGSVILTKNNTAAFLVGPVLFEAIFVSKKTWASHFRNFVSTSTVSALVVLPWVILAGARVSQFVTYTQGQLLKGGTTHSMLSDFWQNLGRYVFVDLSEILTPVLYGSFLVALVIVRPNSKKILYLIASMIGGLVICSSFSWVHQCRYVVPLAVPIAIFTAGAFATAWQTEKLYIRAVLLLIGTIAILQFVFVGFTAYPIRFPGWLNRIVKKVGNFNNPFDNYQSIAMRPCPEADWGEVWALSIIERESQGKHKTLLIMPHLDVVNQSTYMYLAQTRKDNIEVLTGRVCVVVADSVNFNQPFAQAVDWYILKTGDQGRVLADAASKEAYDRWCTFVQTSPRFKFRDMKKLPDQSILEVFERSAP